MAGKIYPIEDKCRGCGKHFGWIMNPMAEPLAIGICYRCASLEDDLDKKLAGRKLEEVFPPPEKIGIVDMCIGSQPAVDGVCGDPDCVCAVDQKNIQATRRRRTMMAKRKLKQYRVEWVIEIEAHSPKEAAQIAQKIQRDQESMATFFTVYDYDLKKAHEIELGEHYG